MHISQVKIRNYTDTDYTDIVEILKEADLFDAVWDSQANLNSITKSNPHSILVAVEQDKVIGNIIIVTYGKKVSYLFRLAVKKEYRRQGIGSALIKKAEEIIKQNGTGEAGLYVDSGNFDLQEYYRKRDFNISPKTYYYMWKDLK